MMKTTDQIDFIGAQGVSLSWKVAKHFADTLGFSLVTQPSSSFAEVIDNLCSSTVERGIVMIENTGDGPLPETVAGLTAHMNDLVILAEECELATPILIGSSMNPQIPTLIASNESVFRQCSKWIDRLSAWLRENGMPTLGREYYYSSGAAISGCLASHWKPGAYVLTTAQAWSAAKDQWGSFREFSGREICNLLGNLGLKVPDQISNHKVHYSRYFLLGNRSNVSTNPLPSEKLCVGALVLDLNRCKKGDLVRALGHFANCLVRQLHMTPIGDVPGEYYFLAEIFGKRQDIEKGIAQVNSGAVEGSRLPCRLLGYYENKIDYAPMPLND